jgi:hypothetical protein
LDDDFEIHPAIQSNGNVGNGQRRAFSTVEPTVQGLLLSLLAVFSIAFGMLRIKWLQLSFPEGVGAALFLLYILVVTSKAASGDIRWAAWGVIACSLVTCFVALRSYTPYRLSHLKEITGKNLWPSIFLFSIFLGFFAWSILMAVVVGPDDWDAWAQWAPKAKILAMSSSMLGDVRYFVPGSGDYPLLWPSLWAFSGWLAGGWEDQWSKGWGPVLMALSAWQLGLFTTKVTGKGMYGFLLAALWVSIPVVPLIASWAYAEAALWLMLLCAMCRLLSWQNSHRANDLIVAGIFIAAAASTKNEGLLFAAIVCFWFIFQLQGIRHPLLHIMMLYGPLVAIWGPWKLYCLFGMGASNHALSFIESGWKPTLSSFGQAVLQVLKIWSDFHQWSVVLLFLLCMFIFLMTKGPGKSRINLMIPAGMLFVSLMVCLFHGANWSWQIGVVWNRLTLQTIIVLAPILVMGSSEEALLQGYRGA